jgi:hypothetical protein
VLATEDRRSPVELRLVLLLQGGLALLCSAITVFEKAVFALPVAG